jgi:hypothetical protein
VEEEGLELAGVGVKGLWRACIKRLVSKGFGSKEDIQETDLPLPARVIPEKGAINLRQAVESEGEKRDGSGWVHKEHLVSNLAASQLSSTLRNEIQKRTLNKATDGL